MITFKSLRRPVTMEADIPLQSEAPDKILTAYHDDHRGELVAWVDNEAEEIGCIRNNRSVIAQLSAAAHVSLFELKPAKGWGIVGLTINSKDGKVLTTVLQARYSAKSLQWLNKIQEELVGFFGLLPQYEDHGYDA